MAVFIDVVIVGALLGAFTGHEVTAVQTTTTTTHNGTKTVEVTKATDDSDDIFHLGAIRVGYNGISLGQDNSAGSKALNFLAGYLGSSDSGKPSGTPFWLVALYLTLLVGIAGQSFGMMIAGLRIVTTDFRPPGIWRTLWRYALALVLWMPILFLSPFMRRVMLHDRWSGTRLITSERVLARALTSTAS